MRKDVSLNLNGPLKNPTVLPPVADPKTPSSAQQKAFLQLGMPGGRLIVASDVVLVSGEAGAHSSVTLRSGERIPTTRDASQVAATLSQVLAEQFTACGGRLGFQANNLWFRPAAITSFAALNAATSHLWFGTAAPIAVPLSAKDVEAALRVAVDFHLVEARALRIEPLEVSEGDRYQGDENDRYQHNFSAAYAEPIATLPETRARDYSGLTTKASL